MTDLQRMPCPNCLHCQPPSTGRSLATGLMTARPWRRRRLHHKILAAQAPTTLIYVPTHPLIKHWLAVARNRLSPPPVFRAAVAELGRCLVYEATHDWLPLVEGEVETPCGVAQCSFVDPAQPIKVVPILRAGLLLLEQATTLIPAAQTCHVGYVRDEETLEAKEYLNKLPASIGAEERILVTDPMLATGGTMQRLLDDLIGRGAAPGNIRVIAVVCAPPALKLIGHKYPGLRIYAGMIDTDLDERGFIVPGLGDAGDRAYGTE